MALLSAGLTVLQALVYHHSPVMAPSSAFIPHQTLGFFFPFHSSQPNPLHTSLMCGGTVRVSFTCPLSCLSLLSLTPIAVLEPDIKKNASDRPLQVCPRRYLFTLKRRGSLTED